MIFYEVIIVCVLCVVFIRDSERKRLKEFSVLMLLITAVSCGGLSIILSVR